jgi:uncharacterized protein (DUF58 family)
LRSSIWLLITAILLLLGFGLKQPALLVAALLFFLTSGIARIWSVYAFKRLEYRLELSEQRVFWGEKISIDISLSNSKFLPLPWVNLEAEIPEEIILIKGKTYHYFKPGRIILSAVFSLGWYHRLRRRYPAHCSKRGMYYFGPAIIASGDPFGFVRKSICYENEISLMVYPPVLSLAEVGIPSRDPFGDIRIRRSLFEDPVQVKTVRQYLPGDPMKRIHWKASARLQKLQSRVFDHTTTPDMAIFLDCRTVADRYYWYAVVSDLLETGILTATAIAADSLKKGYKVGVYANEHYRNSDGMIRIPPSDNEEQMKIILELMAQIRGLPISTIDEVINFEARQISWETTLVLITAVFTEETAAVLNQVRQTGRRIFIILIGEQIPAFYIKGVTVYRVSENIFREKAADIALEQYKQ